MFSGFPILSSFTSSGKGRSSPALEAYPKDTCCLGSWMDALLWDSPLRISQNDWLNEKEEKSEEGCVGRWPVLSVLHPSQHLCLRGELQVPTSSFLFFSFIYSTNTELDAKKGAKASFLPPGLPCTSELSSP
jgi:hypothetical protein